jgi:DHA1 family tetracycline resistance protein-like MFS transporter
LKTRTADLPAGFGTIWTSVAIDLVGWGIVLPILPLYAEEFTDSPVLIGVLVASFSVMQLLFAPVLGRLSDRVGRKPVIVVSLVGTAVGYLVMGLAGSLAVLFAGRIIDGISGGSISAASAAVADMAKPEERARLLGLLSAAFGVGFVAGPAIGGLAALGGDHVPFFVAAAIAGVNALVAVRRLPETRVAGESTPSEEIEMARQRGVRRLVSVAFVAMIGFTAFEATFALLADRRFGLGLAGTSAVFVGIGLGLALVQGGAIRPVVARLGEEATVRAGLALNVAGFLLLAGATSWAVLVPGLALVVAGQGLVSPALTSLVAEAAGRRRRGALLGMQQSANALARVVGPVAGGALFGWATGAPYLLAAVLAGASAAALPGRVGPRRGRTVTLG